MVEFGGWSMPVHYAPGIVAEHHATRRDVGLFDISHMGRLDFIGEKAGEFLDQVLSKAASRLRPGNVRYALVLNQAAGILDDVLVYRHDPARGVGFADGGPDGELVPYSLVVNASNRQKILGWLEEQIAERSWAGQLQWIDRTSTQAMIAVQGPGAVDLFQKVSGLAVDQLKYYTFLTTEWEGAPVLVSRTGYTGEDGVEFVLPAERATAFWERLVAAGGSPAGLGCRDTLRLEAAMPLYGHELDESIHPFQAGLGFAVDLDREPFVGQEALRRARRDETSPRRVGLAMTGKRLPRQGFPVAASAASLSAPIGAVSSGSFSPTLEKPIAMAYVAPECAAVGTSLVVDVRGQAEPATVVELPFYKRPKK